MILAVCGGYQLLGHSYQLGDETLPGRRPGRPPDGPSRRPAADRQRRDRGRARARRAARARRLREPRRPHAPRGRRPSRSGGSCAGHGNNGEDGFEGVRSGNVIGTYLHGPLLPKNAWFADWLIATALRLEQPLAPLDDELEDGRSRGRAARRRASRYATIATMLAVRSPQCTSATSERRAAAVLLSAAVLSACGRSEPRRPSTPSSSTAPSHDVPRRDQRARARTTPLPGAGKPHGHDRRQELHRAVRARRALRARRSRPRATTSCSTATSARPRSRSRRSRAAGSSMYPEYLDIWDRSVAGVQRTFRTARARLPGRPALRARSRARAARPDPVQRHRRDRRDPRLRRRSTDCARWRDLRRVGADADARRAAAVPAEPDRAAGRSSRPTGSRRRRSSRSTSARSIRRSTRARCRRPM